MSYQTLIALTGLTAEQVKHVVIAYEPVWAIGTGLTATDEQANETSGVIREAIRGVYGDAADEVRIQYGGSMNPKNCKGLMAQPEIDGGLIGGASLKAPDFAPVVNFDKYEGRPPAGGTSPVSPAAIHPPHRGGLVCFQKRL